DEIERIEREGRDNFEAIADTIARTGIDCSWEPTGTLIVSNAAHDVPWCADAVESLTRFGYDAELLDRDAVRGEVDSPNYLAGFWKRSGSAQLDPARLPWGLATLAERLGARIHEHTPATAIAEDGDRAGVRTTLGSVRARRAFLATNAFPPLAKEIRRYVL